MTGPCGPLQCVPHGAGMHADERLGGVHGRDVRDEETVHAPRGGEAAVPLQVLRVLRQIFVRPELQRVDEDAQDDAIGALPGAIDES